MRRAIWRQPKRRDRRNPRPALLRQPWPIAPVHGWPGIGCAWQRARKRMGSRGALATRCAHSGAGHCRAQISRRPTRRICGLGRWRAVWRKIATWFPVGWLWSGRLCFRARRRPLCRCGGASTSVHRTIATGIFCDWRRDLGRRARQCHAHGYRPKYARKCQRGQRAIPTGRKLAFARCGPRTARQWASGNIVHQFLSTSLYPAAKCR